MPSRSATITFSIIIPAYNYADTVVRSIESVVTQMGNDSELIVIDDGSTDSTAEIVGEIAKSTPMMQFFKQHNQGLSAVRNKGIDISIGKYLIFLDADDEMAEGALDCIRNSIRQSEGDFGLIIGAHISRRSNGQDKLHPIKPLPIEKNDCFYSYLNKKFSISNGAVAMNREVFSYFRYSERLRHSEDIPVFGQILATYHCVSINQPFAIIYKHADSMRHDSYAAEEAGLEVVNELFDKSKLPTHLMSYRNTYTAQRCLSLFRTLYGANRYEQAAIFYLKALSLKPTFIFKSAYTRKFITIKIKQYLFRQ
jgi:glycosyltransferase involved in cell wall biosynthesis